MLPLNFQLPRWSLPTLLACSVSLGCSSLNYLGVALSNPPLTPISQLQQSQPEATVYLQGKVSNLAPFLDSGAYQLQDETGRIWVLTEQKLPFQGQKIAIEGQVTYQPIPVEGKDLGELYVLEVKQLDSQPQAQPPAPAPSPKQPEIPPPVQPPAQPQPSRQPPTQLDDDLFLPHK